MKPLSISLEREMMAKLDPIEPFMPIITNVNCVIWKNMWFQHAPNSMTLGQNVPSVEEGTRLKITV